ncbi:type 4a pilus biogenesis protein PilO [Caballeronia sp. LZ008]|jgi:Tfp pilus assembly protein PilO|uniref:type 4a pilus biogenesis protein PilO n=1 Tax=unclassified Caballeronia TaxID=2646786 RepID=UPI002027C5F6|nr:MULTISPECIES: type 4a pilus biogenesis protein PilO [unclassified Caballeronia]MDR5794082.1 type 4a pilus biogenesis protein PilO [Caballeronia sp. LZ008]
MSTIPMNIAMKTRSRGALSILQPLDEWSWRRTACVALALSVVVFAFGLRAWRMSDASRLDESRVALAAAQAKAQDAARIADELSGLRARASSGRLDPEHWSAADALRAVADLAAQSGVRVADIEPVAVKGGEPKQREPFPERALKLRADGSFAELRRFLDALAGLPRLVVPENVQIKRQANALAIEATLRIFETLPAVAPAAVSRANAFVIDPFGSADAAAQGSDMLLVGTFVARRRAMALLQSGRDVDSFAPGQKIGDERLGRVVPRAIELAREDGMSRKLTFAEDRT